MRIENLRKECAFVRDKLARTQHIAQPKRVASKREFKLKRRVIISKKNNNNCD